MIIHRSTLPQKYFDLTVNKLDIYRMCTACKSQIFARVSVLLRWDMLNKETNCLISFTEWNEFLSFQWSFYLLLRTKRTTEDDCIDVPAEQSLILEFYL